MAGNNLLAGTAPHKGDASDAGQLTRESIRPIFSRKENFFFEILSSLSRGQVDLGKSRIGIFSKFGGFFVFVTRFSISEIIFLESGKWKEVVEGNFISISGGVN